LKDFSKKDKDFSSAIFEERYEDLAEIRDKYKEKAEDLAFRLASDICQEIDKLGVPYRFENIKANGLAINGYCVISNGTLKLSIPMLMFVLFHELAHNYQYRKYGDNFAESIYLNDISKIDEDCERLAWIENTADKFATLKTNFYINKYDLGSPMSGNLQTPKEAFKNHLLMMKKMVLEMPPEKRNIFDINEALYNLIKMDK
jgi:hypothetical protein